MQKKNTSQVGNFSEAKVHLAFAEAGIPTFVPFGDGAPYDLIIDTGRQILKVQVKTGRLRNGCIVFSTQRHSGRGGAWRLYSRNEIDLFAVYCPDNNKVYLLPLIEGLTSGSLRCAEPKNNQQQNIRWAKDFEFETFLESLR